MYAGVVLGIVRGVDAVLVGKTNLNLVFWKMDQGYVQ